LISENEIYNNQNEGIFFNLAANTTISSNKIRSNSQAASGTFSAIKSQSSNFQIITNNDISGTTHKYGYELDNEAYTSQIVFKSNQIRQTVSGWFNFANGTTDGDIQNGVRRMKGTGRPSAGTWTKGDYVENPNPNLIGTAGSQYIITGWKRLTTGTGAILNTDWLECRTPTGT
jgi:parallel beta-helix repeat protein